MSPKPVTTVPAAMSSGTAAATGVRNTSSRTRIRIGAAISSPLCSASIEDSFTSLPSEGIPARCARTGDRTWARTKSSNGPMTVVMLPPGGIRRSMLMAASPGLGRRDRTCSAAGFHGEIARVPGWCWSASASAGPWRSISAPGPVSRTTSDSLKLPSRRSRQSVDSVPGTNSSDGCTLSSTPRPMSANAATTITQPTSTATACRTAKRAIGVINRRPSSLVGRCPGPPVSLRRSPVARSGPRPHDPNPRPWRRQRG